MSDETEDVFYERADAHIELANRQIGEGDAGEVGASMMFALARFDAWLSAGGFETAEQMKASREESLEFFVSEYRAMLEEHYDDYIENFSEYMDSED
ncbi:MAG: DUF3144 domain-containing protein [Planctomycetota bacterium]